ncbi:Str synth domain-containing protein [Citrus sinensis]|uniref:protein STRICTOSIDINE SYNTHASE-LIKE 4-like n=1 Tax=Citrus sinensis TaxID=2711 RepID=UPI0003D7706E|nr:protein STRICTOSIDINE SYNTHASE-LIKE 4-like [Citrus sinensis]KAH9704641.1 Str synth domain-containing protein [Citrus sinensis]
MAPISFLIACLLAFTLEIFFSPPVSSSASLLSNSKYSSSMKDLIKLGEGCVNHPEDVSVVVRKGALYTATRDGWVKYFILHNETLVNWKHIDSNTFLGITTTKEGDVIVCDTEKGLLKVSEAGVEVLDPNVRFTNDAIEASNGSLYFTVSSKEYTPKEYYKDLVEGNPHGQLLKYDPESNETTVLQEGFYFANGVALSEDESFVVVCESWEFRCRRYWLKGPDQGKLENFIEDLPGGPDNINLAPNGSFGVSFNFGYNMNQTGVRAIQSCPDKWKLLEAYPELINLLIPLGNDAGAQVVKVDTDGKIIKDFNDDNATDISFVTSAVEFEDNLYMASIQSKFVGKLPLNAPKAEMAPKATI